MALGTAAAGGLAWAVARVAGADTRLHPHTAALLYCWALCGVFLPAVTLGYSAVRPLDMATLAVLPLALLTADLLAVGLAGLLSRRSHLIVVSLALLAGVPSIGAYAAAIHFEANDADLALTEADVAVIAELHRRGSPGDLALSNNEQLDRLTLAATNKRIAGGWLTELRGHAKVLRQEFFVEPATLQRQSELLEGLGVRFVLYRSGRGQPPHLSPLLRQVATGDTLTLWEVHPPPFEPLTLAAGDLVRDPFGQIYVYDGRHRRWIRDIATFTSRGYRWEQVQQVSGWQLSTIPEGYPLPQREDAWGLGRTRREPYHGAGVRGLIDGQRHVYGRATRFARDPWLAILVNSPDEIGDVRRVANRLIRIRPVRQRHRLATDLDQHLSAAVIEENVAVRPVNTDV